MHQSARSEESNIIICMSHNFGHFSHNPCYSSNRLLPLLLWLTFFINVEVDLIFYMCWEILGVLGVDFLVDVLITSDKQ